MFDKLDRQINVTNKKRNCSTNTKLVIYVNQEFNEKMHVYYKYSMMKRYTNAIKILCFIREMHKCNIKLNLEQRGEQT